MRWTIKISELWISASATSDDPGTHATQQVISLDDEPDKQKRKLSCLWNKEDTREIKFLLRFWPYVFSARKDNFKL